ncbi:MAG: CAP domain-containing protein [Candidatus Dormibacteria bacterium]
MARPPTRRNLGGAWLPAAGAVVGLLAFAAGALVLAAPVGAQPTGSATSYDGELFSLTNQDRTSNGLGALSSNATLAGIGQARPYYGCSPSPIYGRAADMLTRDYFSHQIPGCTADGGYVWPIMTADGVDWRSAGENIGWNSGYADPAAAANTDFMNSAPHRANILGNYNQLGVGSWYTAGPWNYPGSGGGPYSDVYMFAQEFALVASAPPPAPPPTPQPSKPSPTPSTSGGTPRATPTAQPTPAATSKPTPTPSASPRPAGKPPRGVGARFPESSGGLLSRTIEQVISGYLDE